MKATKEESLLEFIQKIGETVRVRRKAEPIRIGADNDWESRRTSYRSTSQPVKTGQSRLAVK
jgi:hypothetical protein